MQLNECERFICTFLNHMLQHDLCKVNECERLIGTLQNHMLQHDLCKVNECERLIGTFLNHMLQHDLCKLNECERLIGTTHTPNFVKFVQFGGQIIIICVVIEFGGFFFSDHVFYKFAVYHSLMF